MAQFDFPSGPGAGQLYTENGITYVWDTSIGSGVWRATTMAPLYISNPGTVTGQAKVGQTLTYTGPATASGGKAPYTITHTWRKASDGSLLQNGGATYVIPASLVGDSVYVESSVTDSNTPAATATAKTNYIPAPNAVPPGIQGSVIPTTDWAPSPSTGPNASPDTVNTATLKGTASGTWTGTLPTTLTATGDLQINLNGGPFGSSVTVTAAGSTVGIRWNPTTVAGAADGAILTGTVTDGSRTNSYSFQVDKTVDSGSLAFGDLLNQTVSTTVTSAAVTPTGFNVPLSATFAATATNGMATPLLGTTSTAFSASPVTVNPGEALQLRGTTGTNTGTAYGITINLGGQTDTWTAATSAAGAATITPPNILTPTVNATGVGTASGLTITADPYSTSGGAGSPQTSSKWEVYKWIGGAGPVAPTSDPPNPAQYTAVTGSPFTKTTGTLTSLDIAKPPLEANTTYYVRVQYATTNATATTSAFGAWRGFTTGSLLPTTATTLSSPGIATTRNRQIWYDGSKYMFGGSDGSTQNRTAQATSLAGPWTLGGLPLGSSHAQVVWNGSRWLGSTDNNPTAYLAYSTTGTAWSSATGTSYSFNAVYSTFIVQDSSNVLAASNNQNAPQKSTTGGVSYSSSLVALPGTFYPQGGVYFNSTYLISGTQAANQPVLIYNGTGVAASLVFTGTTNESNPSAVMAASPTAAIMACSSGIFRSTNGTSWVSVQTEGTQVYKYSAAYGAGLFVVVGSAGKVLMSADDGLTWVDQTATVGITDEIWSVNYTNSKWLLTVSNGSSPTKVVELT